MNKKNSNGFSLIEVMISLLLLSLVFICLVNSEVFTLQQTKHLWELNTAINQVENVTENLIALNDKAVMEDVLSSWNQQNQLVLPGSKGYIKGYYPQYKVMLIWQTTQEQKNCHLFVNCLVKQVIL